jgi:uncharacterized protein
MGRWMTAFAPFRRYWQELLLLLLVALPWLSLLALGVVWLWQGGYVAVWALAAAAVGLLAWPLSKIVRRRANREARHALGDLAKPSTGWNVVETQAWTEVLAIADATPPFSFAEVEPLLERARETIETVARRFHPEAGTAWSQFSIPDALLLGERLCRDVRREALRHIPGIRAVRASHVLWVHRQTEQYGPIAQTGWRVGHGLWRLVRAAINPLSAVGQEASGAIVERTIGALSYRLRAHFTRLLVLETGRAAIDLYSGRLALSQEELQSAQRLDSEGEQAAAAAPVRILLIGQVSAGKSSLLNALAREVRAAVGPLPTTAGVTEYRLELDGRPAASLVDMPGLNDPLAMRKTLLDQIARADLLIGVVSATQPARQADRTALDEVRAWMHTQRRPPPILLALTHIDQLRPAAEWSPPYDITSPVRAKAKAIRAAMESIAATLDIPLAAIVPVATPPGQPPYNIDALWARIAGEVDEAKLVQIERLRGAQQSLSLREVAAQLANTGRLFIKATTDL